MKKILGNLGIYSVILIALSGSVYAVGRTVSNKSATIDVTATVQPSCTIFANDLLFQITNFNKKIPTLVELLYHYCVQKVLVFLLG